jgi:hypothetical protein
MRGLDFILSGAFALILFSILPFSVVALGFGKPLPGQINLVFRGPDTSLRFLPEHVPHVHSILFRVV